MCDSFMKMSEIQVVMEGFRMKGLMGYETVCFISMVFLKQGLIKITHMIEGKKIMYMFFYSITNFNISKII